MTQILTILSALAEPTRFEAVRLLWDGKEHCVCELMAALDKGQSTMSRHMTSLKKAGLVVDRRDAQWVRYRRNPKLSKQFIALVEVALRADRDKPTGVRVNRLGNPRADRDKPTGVCVNRLDNQNTKPSKRKTS